MRRSPPLLAFTPRMHFVAGAHCRRYCRMSEGTMADGNGNGNGNREPATPQEIWDM